MQEKSLVSGIWKGVCRSDGATDGQRFKSLVRALIPVHTSVFAMQGWSETPAAMPEDVEPIPGICLGDILAEELDADVPYGSLVVIRNTNTLSNISHAVGTLVGEVLLRVIGRGMFPLADEDSVLYSLGLAYWRAAQSEELAKLGLDAASFRSGLNSVLAEYWAQPDVTVCLFSGDDSVNAVSTMQIGLTLRAVAVPTLAELTGFDARPTLNQWTLKLKSYVCDRTGQPADASTRGNVRIS